MILRQFKAANSKLTTQMVCLVDGHNPPPRKKKYKQLKRPIAQCNTGLPRRIESIEKVLNFKIVFQDLEKVVHLAKMYIRY